jgi:hypothetical protein
MYYDAVIQELNWIDFEIHHMHMHMKTLPVGGAEGKLHAWLHVSRCNIV